MELKDLTDKELLGQADADVVIFKGSTDSCCGGHITKKTYRVVKELSGKIRCIEEAA